MELKEAVEPKAQVTVAAVESVLRANLGSRVRVRRLDPLSAGSSRLTWAVDAELDGRVCRLVLQRERVRGQGWSDVDAEARLLRAAQGAGVPVPAVVAADARGAVLGGAFIVTSRVEGETLPRRILRSPELAGARAGFAARCGEILARVHAIPPSDVAPLAATDPFDEITAFLDASEDKRPVFELGLAWLRANQPAPRPATVVHGDFRNGNLVVGPDGVRAVLDWELAHFGEPLEDLGWLCARPWRWGARPAVGGIGTREDLLATYAQAGGPAVAPAELHWWQLLATVRWGAMCLEQARVHLSGAHRSVRLAAIGREACRTEYDVLRMLP